MSEAKEVQAVAQAIEAYLKSHPGAADSLDGIASGWLRQAGVSRSSLDLVRKAVELLLAEGYLEKSVTHSGTMTYRTARKK